MLMVSNAANDAAFDVSFLSFSTPTTIRYDYDRETKLMAYDHG